MFVTIITDCADANAQGRLQTRTAALFGMTPTFVGVSSDLGPTGELQAAGNLIDILDASRGVPGVVLVNAAPRSGTGKRWPNGTPFGYFYYGKTLVVSTVDGYTLSLVKKLKLAQEIAVLDLDACADEAVRDGRLSEADGPWLKGTQFRSFDFQPRAAFWLSQGHTLPHSIIPIDDIPDIPATIWHIDSFGNCKTTLLAHEVNRDNAGCVATSVGTLMCYARLKDVPNGGEALITGSSGLDGNRFLEVVVQGKPAATHFDVTIGSPLIDFH